LDRSLLQDQASTYPPLSSRTGSADPLSVDPHPAGAEVHLDALHRLVEDVVRHGRVALADHDTPARLNHDAAVVDVRDLLDALVAVAEDRHRRSPFSRALAGRAPRPTGRGWPGRLDAALALRGVIGQPRWRPPRRGCSARTRRSSGPPP